MKTKKDTHRKPLQFFVVTLFPEAFASYLKSSILGKAIEKGLLNVEFVHPRDFAYDKHRIVDDRPYAGGAGMVMKAEPIAHAVDFIIKKSRTAKTKIVLLAVAGKQFTNATAIQWSKLDRIIFISGRYEGIDERAVHMLKDLIRGKKNISFAEISIGPYIVMGGELPALTMIDSVSRHIDGVLGKSASREEVRYQGIAEELNETIAESKSKTPSLESYTRPPVIKYKGKTYKVPPVLTTGDHKKIAAWKAKRMKFV
jgi:tRNA (guanine37-N1)-methyltransferase